MLRLTAAFAAFSLLISGSTIPAQKAHAETGENGNADTIDGTVMVLPNEPELAENGGAYLVSDDEAVTIPLEDSRNDLITGQPLMLDPTAPDSIAPEVGHATSKAATANLHKADVVVIANAESFPSKTATENALGYVSDYWVEQSNNKISGVELRSFITLSVNSGELSNYCAGDAWVWEAYAQKNPSISLEKYLRSKTEHLILLLSGVECGYGSGVGLATIGVSGNSGGLIWATIDFNNMPTSHHVLAHELGHNFSLDHANQRYCAGTKSDAAKVQLLQAQQYFWGTNPAAGCVDYEYADYYDIMSAGISIELASSGVFSSAEHLPALNVSQKNRLGVLSSSQLRKVKPASGMVQDFTVNTITASGRVGLQVVDPSSSDPLFVEYRAGTGRDAASFYMQFAATSYRNTGPGVRVLRMQNNDINRTAYSTALQTKLASNVKLYDKNLNTVPYLVAGNQIKSHTGQVTIRVLSVSGTQAKVRVTYQPIKTKKVTISGKKRVGATLTAKTKSWSPNKTKLSYQWKINGKKIKGATKKTLKLKKSYLHKKISVTVKGSRSGYSSASETSASVKVAKGVLTSKKPKISGTKRVGKKLKASTAKWTSGTKLYYQWNINGKKIKGATKKTLKLKKAYLGKKISVTVTGKKAGYKNKNRSSNKYTVKNALR